MSNNIISSLEEKMKKTAVNLKENFAVLRTGRASAALFDKIRVDAYGDKQLINQVANISVPEARLVIITPWDKALIGEIEKAIRNSELSLNPSNDGKVIRINIPPLTGERRKELVKVAKNHAEQSKVALRNIRRDGNDELKKQLKAAEITEDDEKKAQKDLQDLTKKYTAEIDKILAEKETEIMED
ncbi:MAG: ribosome recycling factor [Treponema sp.]|jgi:ribosome recycling factor|nr:ribosome recycling factor [Treponema sp.]